MNSLDLRQSRFIQECETEAERIDERDEKNTDAEQVFHQDGEENVKLKLVVSFSRRMNPSGEPRERR